jgi:transglutaminase-like putative cysteine protease
MTLVQVQEKQSYDVFAAVAKALVIFLLVYGALGGFLSAFEIEYNKGVCMLILFLMALVLSVVYETGKKWLMNLMSLGLFGIYIYIALSNYWVINSGYYEILNRVYEKAREYLGVTYGTEYSLMVENEYVTVTIFVLFLGMVGTILFNIQMQNKCSLFKVVLLTFTPYVIPLYLECTPSMIYIIFLFAGYVAVAVLQGGNVREHLSGQMRYILPLTVVTAAVVVRLVSVLLPEENYSLIVPSSAGKVASEEQMTKLAQYGMMALFQAGSDGAGVSGGMLSRGSAVLPSYETDLIVRFTPYSYEPIYLKAFTGKDYLGDRWTSAWDSPLQDEQMFYSTRRRRIAYETDSSLQGRGIMEVENVGASAEYEYFPYYTDYACVNRSEEGVVSYTYYPRVRRLDTASEMSGNGYGGVYPDDVDEAYLYVPSSCQEAVREVCEEAGFSGTAEEIAQQVVDFFQENYSYTLRPGFYYGSSDYITHFLLESKRGYCAHFASAGTMVFRNLGIPARYVEGYAFSYADVVEDGTLVEGVSYEDYYSGYSPIGETALVEMEIPDANAHAWVEIYVENEGWIVVDPTPSSSATDSTSFWDAFADINQSEDGLSFGESNLGTYLEKSLGGISYALLAAAVILLVVLAFGHILRRHRERKLPAREQVKLEYLRLKRRISRKHKEFRTLRTLGEQLNWLREHCGLEITQEQEQALYQVFFGETVDYDCGELRRKLLHFWI